MPDTKTPMIDISVLRKASKLLPDPNLYKPDDVNYVRVLLELIPDSKPIPKKVTYQTIFFTCVQFVENGQKSNYWVYKNIIKIDY